MNLPDRQKPYQEVRVSVGKIVYDRGTRKLVNEPVVVAIRPHDLRGQQPRGFFDNTNGVVVPTRRAESGAVRIPTWKGLVR